MYYPILVVIVDLESRAIAQQLLTISFNVIASFAVSESIASSINLAPSVLSSGVANRNETGTPRTAIKNSIECSNKKYSGLSITNIGNKTVYVTSFGYRIDGDKGFAYINPHLSTDGVITPFVPHALNPEQSLTFLVEKPIVDGYLMPEFAAKKKIKLFCSDSTNNFYYVRIKKEFCT